MKFLNTLIINRVKGLGLIKPILKEALDYHLKNSPNISTNTVVLTSDLSTEAVGTTLPLIPDSAIHYRCGDNFIGHYGFLPFKAFSDNIPRDVKTIYVLAENKNRKTINKKPLVAKCDSIFVSMLNYLKKHFPSAKIVIRRGDDLYIDMARLAYAKTAICSVSTFCLWPAIMNEGSAFFPKTRLIVGGDTNINLGFKWITSPSVLSGVSYLHSPPSQLIAQLNE